MSPEHQFQLEIARSKTRAAIIKSTNILRFGKYKDMTFTEAWDKDPEYMNWLLEQPWVEKITKLKVRSTAPNTKHLMDQPKEHKIVDKPDNRVENGPNLVDFS